MLISKLRDLLKQAIQDDLSYLELRAVLIDFKEEGGHQRDARSVLEELYHAIGDEYWKDKLLELIELTEGMGIKTLRVW
ncbi:MAG: hypothetical protein AAFW73_02490 [Bacteroidota bacterium]|mgnify:FL=1